MVYLRRHGEDADFVPIQGLDLTPRAFGVVVYSTGHFFQTQVRCWSAGADDGAVGLELPVPLARLELWQAFWHPTWSDIEDVYVLGFER